MNSVLLFINSFLCLLHGPGFPFKIQYKVHASTDCDFLFFLHEETLKQTILFIFYNIIYCTYLLSSRHGTQLIHLRFPRHFATH